MEARISGTPALDPQQDLDARKKRLLQSCQEFESVMLSYLLKSMEDSVMKAEEPGQAAGVYQDMFVAQMSRQLGKDSALGFGDMLYSKLEPLLETNAHPASRAAAPAGKQPHVQTQPHATAKADGNGLKNSAVTSDSIKKKASPHLGDHRTRERS